MNKKVILTIIVLLLFIILLPNISMARPAEGATAEDEHSSGYSYYDPTDNPDAYKPGSITDSEISAITDKANIIFNVIFVLGIIVSVITLLIIGIKYMIGSVQERAEYKKTMIPYIVGAFMLISITTILRILSSMVTDLTSTI